MAEQCWSGVRARLLTCLPAVAGRAPTVAEPASGAGAFCFFGFGIKAFQCSRIDERMFGQLQAFLESEDDADEGVVVRGTEPVVRGARARAR